MLILRDGSPIICPVITETEKHLSDRISDFFEEDCFIIELNQYGQYTVTMVIDGESIPIQELFPSVDKALERIELCKKLGVEGYVRNCTPSDKS